MKILIDNGHGKTTPGKRSPDGRFLEYIFNRTIARQIVADLADRGYDAELLVPEDDDIPLVERCSRANAIVSREGTDNVILVSIHTNASERQRMDFSLRLERLYEQRTNPSRPSR